MILELWPAVVVFVLLSGLVVTCVLPRHGHERSRLKLGGPR